MADKGIIFSAPMVRALLDGRKTQTRRLFKARWGLGEPSNLRDHGIGDYSGRANDPASWGYPGYEEGCDASLALWPELSGYAPGDRLYVREAAWIAPVGWTDSPVNPMGPHRQEVAYAADDRSGYTANAAKDYKLRLRPSIHMPRWASRLWLAVTEVRVQRLQEISEADSIAEGIEPFDGIDSDCWGFRNYAEGDEPRHWIAPIDSYRTLWNSLHTEPGTRWEDYPWIVAVSFGVHHGNIDAEVARG